jgi:hypothetical protein
MLLHSSSEVIKAVNAAHRYYVETERLDWRTYKKLYAAMIKAMRRDGFSPTEVSVQELADNILWTIGTNPKTGKHSGSPKATSRNRLGG